MVDQVVGVINQSTQTVAPVDVSQLTNPEGQTVNRQRVTLGDSLNPSAFATVDANGYLRVDEHIVREVLLELRAIRVGISILINQDIDPASMDGQ